MSECPYCTSENEAVRETYFDQCCEACVARMLAPEAAPNAAAKEGAT